MSSASAPQPERGVLIEFDFAVLTGHQLLLDVCRERLQQEGVEFDKLAMARWMGGRSFSAGLHAMSERLEKTIDIPEVVAECKAELNKRLVVSLGAIPTGFTGFVRKVLASNAAVTLVSRLDSAVVQQSFSDIEDPGFLVMQDGSPGFGFFTWECWRRAARKSNLPERLCLAIAGSGYSVKGALNTGMSVIARTCDLTDYQDFGGSNVYITEYSDALAKDVVRLLRL